MEKCENKTFIKNLNDLSLQKTEFLNLKEITLTINTIENNRMNLNIDIEIKLIKNDLFNIELFGIKKDIEWNILKQLFFYGLRLKTSYYFNNIIKISNLFGIEKKDLFDKLKKLKLLESLK